MKLKVGDRYPTWFSTEPDGMSVVLAITPYRGHYPQHFTHVLKLSAPRTHRGWMEKAVKLEDQGEPL